MAQHLEDRIIAAVIGLLSGISSVTTADCKPLELLEEDELPAALITEVSTESKSSVGGYPADTTYEMRLVVQLCDVRTKENFLQAVGELHEAAARALVGSENAVRLNGLLQRGLSIRGASLFTDSQAINQVVGGWRIELDCTYNLRSDQPGNTEKELS